MTLELSINEQLWSCLASLVFGVFAGILYDVFSIFYICIGATHRTDRKSLKFHLSSITVFVFDLLYCAIISIAFAVLTYAFSYGRFRLVFFMCSAVGFGAYIMTLGKLIMFASEKIVSVLKVVLHFIIKCVCIPFKFIFRGTAWVFRKIYTKTIAILLRRMSLKRDIAIAHRAIKEKVVNYIKL